MAENSSPETMKMQKRAVATRLRFLEATLQCLAEKGYAETTTQEVCRRLGASRGTLLHHFATREELIIEAVEYILGENVRHFRKTMAGISGDHLTLTDISRHLWEEHWTSNTFYAWLELVVASRTDPALNRQVRSLEERWMKKFSAAFSEVMGRELDGVFWLFFLALNALSIEKIRSTPERVDRALEDLMAFVEIADRFFIQYAGRAAGINNGQDNKTSEEKLKPEAIKGENL